MIKSKCVVNQLEEGNKQMFLWLGRKNVASLPSINIPTPEIRKRISILAIDDCGFPEDLLEILENNEFNIKTQFDIDNILLVEGFDIILCDIQGVGRKLSPEFQGAHMIKEIKRQYPFKYVVSYSASDINPKYGDYISKADVSLRKDADVDKWIDTLDQAIQSIIDPKYQWSKLHMFLAENNVDTTTIAQIERDFTKKYINRESDFPSKKFDKLLNPQVWDILNKIAKLIVKLWTLLPK